MKTEMRLGTGAGWRSRLSMAGALAVLTLASAPDAARPGRAPRPDTSPSEAPPSWVKSFPYDPRLYVGIGRGDKTKHPGEYRERAQASALAQISREISIQLKAENVSTRSEDAFGQAETFDQKISASSRNELTGYELADVHETETAYWVLYTLDKENFQRSLDEREKRFGLWLEGEATALESELEGRRLQQAMDRYERVAAKYASAFANDPLIRNRSAGIPSRYMALGEKIGSASRGLKLVSGSSAWVMDYRDFSASNQARPVDISLVDGKSGEKWKGPLSLSLSNLRSPGSPPCRVETGEEGNLDLASAFLGCGMRPGSWKVTWKERDGRMIRLDVKAALIPMDISVKISGKAAEAGNIRAGLEEELTAANGPFFNFISGQAPLPLLEIEIRELAMDSLEGMYFTSIRGSARYPGMPKASEIRGKAGHADKVRSQTRALRDFARQVAALPESTCHIDKAESPF